MKAYLIDMHLLVPRSRSSAKVKVKYKRYISQKMAVSGAFVFQKHIFFFFLAYPSTFFKQHLLNQIVKRSPLKLIPSKTLVAMATTRNCKGNFLTIFSSETAGQVLKLFHRNIPLATLFNFFFFFLRDFDSSRNMAVVVRGYLHYTDMKKFVIFFFTDTTSHIL